ncbi:hypothetical protein Glove_18g35 [Diversispora epigaea]|uniref:Uncharacterized protein n=1 Tax=Diversispora epigaea TaxID=1348612 RepID=A0A397JQS8_9GLOM|nr:hypothetical protein Glove_18g35 [Diversispora epigaea]
MASTQSTIDLLKELNLKLVLQVDELRKENAEVKLEKKNKTDTTKLTTENAELKDRVTKLEQKQAQVITDERGASYTKLQSLACSELSVNIQIQQNLKHPNPLSQDIINDNSVEILEFVETVHKERISIEIRERNRKKKLQSQGSMQNTSSSSETQNEQGLKHDFSVFIKENNNKISDVFDIQIPEFSLEVIITGSGKITAQNITDLFIIAMKVRQKKILCCYCYHKTLLLDITDVNLRQRTFREKNFIRYLWE